MAFRSKESDFRGRTFPGASVSSGTRIGVLLQLDPIFVTAAAVLHITAALLRVAYKRSEVIVGEAVL